MAFSEKTLAFLAENRLRNSREWYHSHKEDYEAYVLEPLRELVDKLAPVMLKIDPQLVVEPKVGKCISRIYRDTRFSKDKSLYREVMWCVFVRDKKLCPDYPGLVMEFSPDGFRYGCGYYCAPAKVMESMRKLILKNDPAFQSAFCAVNRQKVFALEGDCFKRSRHGAQPEELRNWLDRKNIDFMHNSRDFPLLFSENLHQRLAEDFQLLAPFYTFMCKAREQMYTEV